jgi:APA family basic amino acid/polyamine antiporter
MVQKNKLDFFSTFLYGVGIIIGAGIYSLVGLGASYSGYLLWISFAIGGLIAAFSAFSYAELSTLMPKEAAEYHYVLRAFKVPSLAFIVEWLVVFGNIALVATVALGFGNYFTSLFGGNIVIVALSLTLICAVLNYFGITLSAVFNNICSILSVIGLVLVAFVVLISPTVNFAPLFDFSNFNLSSSLGAVSVIFFAFIGFEKISNISEEVQDPKKNVPRAMLLSLAFSSIFYCLISFSLLSVSNPSALAASHSPLSDVFASLGYPRWILSFIALFATSNTVLLGQIVASRILFGMSKAGKIPKIFSKGKKDISIFSIIFVCLFSCIVIGAGDIKFTARFGDLVAFLAYFAVNCSLLVIYKKSNSAFKSPRLFGFPILALLGALSSLFFVLYLGYGFLIEILPVILLGLLISRIKIE